MHQNRSASAGDAHCQFASVLDEGLKISDFDLLCRTSVSEAGAIASDPEAVAVGSWNGGKENCTTLPNNIKDANCAGSPSRLLGVPLRTT